MAKPGLQNLVVQFASQEPIFSEGDPGATMFIVQSGKVRLFREQQGARRELGIMEKGDFFGEMSILEGLPRTHSAEAVDDTELIEISSMTFDRMIRSNIEIAVRLLRKLSIRLRDAERKNVELQASGARVASKPVAPKADSTERPAAVEAGVRLESTSDGTTYPLSGAETLIGRYDPVTEQRPDVDLTEVDLKRSVSRRHAKIVANGDGFAVIEEVGALNGTAVNGNKLVTGTPQPLLDGDQLSVGLVQMVFRT